MRVVADPTRTRDEPDGAAPQNRKKKILCCRFSIIMIMIAVIKCVLVLCWKSIMPVLFVSGLCEYGEYGTLG